MGINIETGIGKAVSGKDFEMGRTAANDALRQIKHLKSALAIIFVSSELDIIEVNRGINEVIGSCPVIGTSTAGEIADGHLTHSVVVAVIASPHLRVRTGLGKNVASDFKKAVGQALNGAGAADFFNSAHPLHQMLHMSTSVRAGLSPVLLIVFSPGATRKQPSLSHDIHTELRKASENRIPIFGGSSSDNFHFESNYQIVNGAVSDDAIALAFIEAEILFGIGTAHGFSPTTKRALITKASGHIVHELDGRPANEVCAELLNMPVGKLGDGVLWFSQYPFGTTDLYGNSLLNVPECVLPDGSIQFGPIMRNDQIITLMRADRNDILNAGVDAYSKAVRHGGLNRPSLAMMFSCALRKRLMGDEESKEMEIIRKKTNIPFCGFYTFGEQGISDDGLPVFFNQSVSTLVFSDELNPITALIHKGKRIYHEFTSQVNKKENQMKMISGISQIIQEESDARHLLITLQEKHNLFQWADWKFYLSANTPNTFSALSGHGMNEFPLQIRTDDLPSGFIPISLNSQGTQFGMFLLKRKSAKILPDKEDIALAKMIGRLIARGLQRIEIDRKLNAKLIQLEILNHLNNEISKSITSDAQLQNIVRHIRRILKLSAVSLWLTDDDYRFIVREAADEDEKSAWSPIDAKNDENLAKWQTENCVAISIVDMPDNAAKKLSVSNTSFISLPISYKDRLKGILNLFWEADCRFFFQYKQIRESMEFLTGIANQLAIFIENKYLQKNTTFLKEIHHRIKNNLQNIASLLRLQIRRLDGISAEQALSDGISRIMSIAVVHETLCHGGIGIVDLRKLVDNVGKLSLSGINSNVSIDISGPSVMVPSKEATSIALIVNELIQNAARHGYNGWQCDCKISVVIDKTAKNITVSIQDNGIGFPENFNANEDGNLGLSIVRTLVKDDLHGKFLLNSGEITTAKVVFPFPKDYYELRT